MFSKLCWPVKIYVMTMIFGLASSAAFIHKCPQLMKEERDKVAMGPCPTSYLGMVPRLAFQLLFLYWLNHLCKRGHNKWAWFFLFLPVIFLFFAVAALIGSMAYLSQNQSQYQSQ